MADTDSTEARIVDAATRLVQMAGYSAFSYADVAEEVGIRKASIHYHFPSKSSLGVAVVRGYRATVRGRADAIRACVSEPGEHLERYAQIYRDMGRGAGPWDTGRICACAALTAEGDAVPESVRREVRGFFAENEHWLSSVLSAGRTGGTLSFAGDADAQGCALLSGLHGAMLAARARRDITHYCTVAHQLLAQLGMGTRDIYPLDAPVSAVQLLSPVSA